MAEPDEEGPGFIEVPDEMDDDPEKNGLVCFIDQDRVCGAACMAYTTFPSESKMLNDQQKHCTLIVSAERLGRHTGGMLKLVRDVVADLGRRPPTPSTPKGT